MRLKKEHRSWLAELEASWALFDKLEREAEETACYGITIPKLPIEPEKPRRKSMFNHPPH
jgi:hypothetical protein